MRLAAAAAVGAVGREHGERDATAARECVERGRSCLLRSKQRAGGGRELELLARPNYFPWLVEVKLKCNDNRD